MCDTFFACRENHSGCLKVGGNALETVERSSNSISKVIYQIVTDRPAYALRGRTVKVCESELGTIGIVLNGSTLDFNVYHKQPKQVEMVTSKDVEHRTSKPARDHSWRNY